jgi:hypothetical protein
MIGPCARGGAIQKIVNPSHSPPVQFKRMSIGLVIGFDPFISIPGKDAPSGRVII